ncbi:alpha-L-glutamate ligase-like protein [Halobacteriovorax sp. HLS]|uniref:alpha-L-glutamate ligase-like protein n=1 Tax=Halobacteriovorax sp. HLS TaxID=2234000 RepID=UPI000FDA4FA5|nr:alpha-L-glutamate ligase-like protein [Halobacteriovorax sp. HLS]
MFGYFKKLRAAGVLGINERVGRYILPLNERKFFPLVDDKVLTEKRAKELNVPMPRNYFVVSENFHLKSLESEIRKLDSFVIKPSCGAMGNGIILITKIEKTDNSVLCYNPSGKKFTLRDISQHISGILSGLYSLSGNSDKAMIQELIFCHDIFDRFSYKGIPDVRVIVHKGVPVMAMTRLPTKESDGKANLHQGAIGCGIDLKTGRVNYGVHKDVPITHHPDTGVDIQELVIPYWDTILEMAANCYKMAHLGYLGADIILDQQRGPMLLEVNARPGLAIQTANKCGLLNVLEK